MLCFVRKVCFLLFCFFPLSSVLKILGELNSNLPSKVVEDFSMVTQRNNNVSNDASYHVPDSLILRSS